ncbi:MAG: VWA domain-containing protein [bacterium]|nr:VWA domain-containing protein [bacterium]
MKFARLAPVALLAAVLVTSFCTTVDAATASKSSTHFRITYDTTKTTATYAAFILKESERAWTAIFTTMGYKQPKWMSDRITAGGKVMLSVKDVGEMLAAATSTYYIDTKVVIRGTIAFHYESKYKKGGKTNWHLLRGTCGHEFFHLVQGAYDVDESKWLKETTSVWMESKAFPVEAKAHPDSYGFRRFLWTWKKHRRHVDLMSTGDKHEYAASFFIQYLTEHDSRGDGVVKTLWEKAAAVKGDTTAKSLAQTLGDNAAWGSKTLKRIRGLALTDLVRSSKRNKTFSLAALVKGPYYTPTLVPMKGLTVPKESGGKMHTIGRTVAKLTFDCVNIMPDPVKVGSPVDVVLAAGGTKEDGAWEFHAVRAPKKGTWKVKRFRPPTKNKWTEIRLHKVDFRKEKLFFVATRVSATTKDKYRLSGIIITPPVIESFEVHAPSDEGGRELVWATKRTQWNSPVQGTGWRSEIGPQTGIAYNPEESAEIRIILNRPVSGGLTLKLGPDLSPAVTAAGSSKRKFRARVKIKDLESFLEGGEIPVEVRGKDMFGMGLDGRPWTAPQIEFKGTKAPKLADIRKWEGAESPFVKPGGLDNLGGRKIPLYRPKKPGPEIVLVKLSRKSSGEVFYHSVAGNYRPMTGGKVEVEIAFAKPMDPESMKIKYHSLPVTGKFKTPKTWIGSLDIPEGEYAFKAVKGLHPLSIQAKTAQGTAIDTDPETEGDQADTTHKIAVDGIPTYIESVEVYGMGAKFYEAYWTGGPDLKKAKNLSVAKIGDQRRKLKIRVTKDLPAEAKGTLQISVRSSQPLSGPPTIKLGSVAVTKVTSEDKMFWQGEVSAQAVRAEIKSGNNIPISISAIDIYGDQLDADPRTVPALATKRPLWRGYESQRGGDSRGYGGVDKWHEIGPSPKISFVIVLDASGSMGDEGRMVNAKAGIKKLLDSIPEGVELAIVIFQGSSSRAVGFTTDVGKIRTAVDSVSARGGTPLAAAIAKARIFLESSSHPMSFDWRYRIFSDGHETGGGNVVLQTRLLDQAIARRKGKPVKVKNKDKIPPPKPVAVDKIPIRPQRWTAHAVKIDSRTGLDWIWLVEVSFTEKELPDGRCYVRFESKAFGVAYGSITDADGSNKRIKWQVNSRPSSSRSKVMRATSDDGKAAIDRIRRHAATMKAKTKSMQKCRQEIQQNVEREVK